MYTTIFRPITFASNLYFLFILWQLKMLFSILLYFHSYVRALFTIVHIYFLGVYYLFYEFFVDCRSGIKMTTRKSLLNDRIKNWSRNLKQMRKDQIYQSADVNQDSSELVAVITGADGTIGSEILKYLLAMDFIVFAIGLYPLDRQFQHQRNLHFIKCDLGNIDEVFSAIENVQLSIDRIDLLILNAAMFLSPKIGWLPYRRNLIGAQIIERHLAVNVLANAQLFASLSQRLEQSVLQNGKAIFVSSCSARAGDLSLLLRSEEDNLSSERFWCRHLNGYKSYADSKLLLTAYVQYLNKVLRYRDSRIMVASVHPGVVPGRFYRNVFWPFRCVINRILAPFMRTPLHAATHILDVACSLHLNSTPNNNVYYENGVPSNINSLQNQENVWLYGRCVREMIVDNDEVSSLGSIAKNDDLDETSRQKQIDKSSAEFFERLLSEATGDI